MFTDTERREFLAGYLDCSAFANVVNDDASGPVKVEELPADFRAQAEHACQQLLDAHPDDLTAYCEQVEDWHGGPDSRGRTSYTAMERAGHDFAYSRNGHGTGYWARGVGELGSRLSDAAAAMGEHWAIVEQPA